MTTLPDLYRADGYVAKRVASTGGGEYAGPCPYCGGRDRFHLWPETERWWCRQCNKSGDLPGYLMEFHGMAYPAAMERLGLDLPKRPVHAVSKPKPKPQPWTPPAATSPPDLWAEKAAALVKWARAQLMDDAKAISYLGSRGLTLGSVKTFSLGLVPADLWRFREDWGLPPMLHEDGPRKGKPKKLWIPAGIVIPTFGPEGEVLGIKIRRWAGEPRYYRLPGSANRCLVAGSGTD